MFSSFGGGGGAKKTSTAAASKQFEPERAAAVKTVADCHAKIRGPMEQMHSVANSAYWRNGYMGGTFIAAGAVTFLISSKVPAFASVGSIGSIAAGLVLGPKLHDIHVTALKRRAANELDKSIAICEEGAKKYGSKVPLYYDELQTLRRMRDELLPPGGGSGAAGGPQEGAEGHAAADLDSRVAQVLLAYEQRRGSIPKEE